MKLVMMTAVSGLDLFYSFSVTGASKVITMKEEKSFNT